MKVVHVHNVKYDVANGIYKTVAGLVTWLPSVGVEVEAWNLTTTVTQPTLREVRGVRVIDLPTYSKKKGLLKGLPPITRQYVAERHADVDLVHFHSVMIPDNIWLAKLLRMPYVTTPNGGYGAEGSAKLTGRIGKALWMAWQEGPFVRRAKALLAVSESEQAALKARWPQIPVHYTINAIDLPDGTVESAPPTRDFVFVGRLAIDHKGLDRMVRGFAAFARRAGAGETSRLVLAGPDWRGMKGQLEQLVREQGMTDRVVFLPPLFGAEKQRLMSGALAFVHTSRWEGLPFSVLEAMSLGTPVMVTPETNLSSYVTRYGAGIEVAGNDDAIADGFAKLALQGDTQRQAMSAAARRLVEENFTWTRAAQQARAAYEQVLSDTGTSRATSSMVAGAPVAGRPVPAGERAVEGACPMSYTPTGHIKAGKEAAHG